MLLVLFLSTTLVSASELENTNMASTNDENPIEILDSVDYQDEINLEETPLQVAYHVHTSDINNFQETS